MCSFNVEAFGLAAVTQGMTLTSALFAIFDHGANSLSEGLTPDPAGVSKPIKLLLERTTVVARLERARGALQTAIDADTPETAADALAGLFWKYEVPVPGKQQLAAALRRSGASSTSVAVAELGSRLVKPTRAFGGARRGEARYRGHARPKWYLSETERSAFARGRKAAYGDVHGALAREGPQTLLVYAGEVTVPYYEARDVTISFGKHADPDTPFMTADGPTRSPHRYADGALCIWYPDDPPERRWTRQDGLVPLLDLVALHLFREAWWRESGEWLGPQAPHRAA
jgi:hypothetical protein